MTRGRTRPRHAVIGRADSPHNQLQRWLVIVRAGASWSLCGTFVATPRVDGFARGLPDTCVASKTHLVAFLLLLTPNVIGCLAPHSCRAGLIVPSFCSTAAAENQSVAMA